MGARLSSPTQLETMPKKPKGVGKPSASKIAADKRRQREEHLRKAQETAFKGLQQRMILLPRWLEGQADAEIAKKGGKRK